MQTNHRVVVGDAGDLPLDSDAVELVVTSPPYPMIEMWDETFTGQDPRIGTALEAGDGQRAFDLMHELLADAWGEIARVLVPGGIAAVNVGDATRTVGGEFRSYPNHARILAALEAAGLDPLPDVLWRKPTNSAAKFMGSGMLPPNAYVTLEHEFVLLARKPGMRSPDSERRHQSAYFWEERNEWFSDVWAFRGERQAVETGPRERTGAFPFELPYRVINMYSVHGDTVLDPFLGTATTTLAAMASARSSIGVEIDPALATQFDPSAAGIVEVGTRRSEERLRAHEQFVAERDEEPGYDATHYDTKVVTKQERDIRLPTVESVTARPDGWQVEHDYLQD